MTTRREFLKKSAVVAAGSLLIPDGFNIKLSARPKVIIIGAGLAGLAAAYKLPERDTTLRCLKPEVEQVAGCFPITSRMIS